MKNRILVVPANRITQMKTMDRSSLLRLNFGTGTPADFLQLKETYAVAWLLTDVCPQFSEKKARIASGMGFMKKWREEDRKPEGEEFSLFIETYDEVYDLFAHVPLEDLSNAYKRIVREDDLSLPEAFSKGDPTLLSSTAIMPIHPPEDVAMRRNARAHAPAAANPYV